MRDDWLNSLGEATGEHGLHLVPRLEHLSAVDALYLQAFENDVVPIDRKPLGGNAQHRHLTPRIHGGQYGMEGAGHARHLQRHVEALAHANSLAQLRQRSSSVKSM